MKLIITGGHLTPAIATIDELLTRNPRREILFIGRRVSFEGSSQVSQEEQEMAKRSIPFISLFTGRLQRVWTIYTFISLLKIPVGFIQALIICLRYRPQCILSFGGYIGLPVAVAGAMLGIPVIIHEQTRHLGLSNRIIAKIAKKICISYEDLMSQFPADKVCFTGLPVRKELFEGNGIKDIVNNPEKLPIIYLTGGSTGSVSVNSLVYPVLKEIVTTYILVHQTGSVSYSQAMKEREKLPQSIQNHYVVQEYFSSHETGALLKIASLVIARSGANTVMELAMLAKNAILIPLPWSGHNEQQLNAEWLVSHGSATLLHQNNLSPEALLKGIGNMMNPNRDQIKKAKDLSDRIPRNGAALLADVVEEYN